MHHRSVLPMVVKVTRASCFLVTTPPKIDSNGASRQTASCIPVMFHTVLRRRQGCPFAWSKGNRDKVTRSAHSCSSPDLCRGWRKIISTSFEMRTQSWRTHEYQNRMENLDFLRPLTLRERRCWTKSSLWRLSMPGWGSPLVTDTASVPRFLPCQQNPSCVPLWGALCPGDPLLQGAKVDSVWWWFYFPCCDCFNVKCGPILANGGRVSLLWEGILRKVFLSKKRNSQEEVPLLDDCRPFPCKRACLWPLGRTLLMTARWEGGKPLGPALRGHLFLKARLPPSDHILLSPLGWHMWLSALRQSSLQVGVPVVPGCELPGAGHLSHNLP